jgi:autotransporter-associated beta strand protein
MGPTGAAAAAFAKKLVPAGSCLRSPAELFPPLFPHPGVVMPRHASALLRAVPGCPDASVAALSTCLRRFTALPLLVRSVVVQAVLALAVAAAVAAMTGDARAANVTWDGSSNANWSRKQNWSTVNLPGSGDDVFFASGFKSSGTAISLDGSYSIRSLTVNTATSFSIAPSAAGNTLTLASGSLARLATATGTQTIAANVTLGADAVWTIAGGGRMVVSGTIDDGSGTFSLTKSGTGTLQLSAANTFGGATTVAAGVLASGANNVLPDATLVTLGAAATRGTLNLGAFSDTIAGLAFSGSGGTLQMAAGQTGTAQLVTTSTLALGSAAALDLTGMSTGAGLYRLVSYASQTGTFGSVTGLAGGYQLVYGATELAAQQQAVLGTVTVTHPAAAIIAGGTAGFTYTVANTNASGGASLAFTGTGTGNVAGSSSGTAQAAGTSAGAGGLYFTGTTSGTGQAGTFTVTAPGAFGATTASGTVRVDVYGHALLALASSTVALGNTRAGVAVSGTLAAQNAPGFRVGLTSGSAAAGNVTLTGLTNVAAGGTASIVATLSGSQVAGPMSQSVAYTFGDSGTAAGLSGYRAVTGTQTVTVTGAVYDSAQAKYSGGVLDFGVVHRGASVGNRTVAIGNQTVTDAGYQDLLNVSGSTTNPAVTATGFTGLAASAGGTTTRDLVVGVSTASAGSLAATVHLTLVSDANGVAGLVNGVATTVGSPGAITTAGGVFSGVGVWNAATGGAWGTGASGNWTSAEGVAAAPGTFAGFSSSDVATFGGAVASGSAAVTLGDANPSLAAVTFANAAARYLLSGGTLTLDGGQSTALVQVASGTHEIAAAVALASDATLTAASAARLTISGAIGGTGGLQKLGAGVVALAGTNTYTGPTSVAQGTLVLDGAVAGGVNVAAGGMVMGRGQLAGRLAGPGTIGPGDSIGILTATDFDPGAGAGVVFQFSGTAPNYANAAASVNDVLRLTSGTMPFVSSLTAANAVDIFLDVSAVAIGDTFRGGFFTAATGSLLPSIAGANYRYFVRGDGGGHAATHDGMNYYALDAAFLPGFTGVAVKSATVPLATFASGTVSGGSVAEFAIVPEPAAASLAAIGLGIAWLIRGLAVRRWRRPAPQAAATGSARR